MSPVPKSVRANPARRTKEGVLREGFLQIAAKIRPFVTTAGGDRMETTTDVGKITT